MQKPRIHLLEEDRSEERSDIAGFLGTLVVVSLVTLLLYLVPIGLLITGLAVGFIASALYFIVRY